MRESREAEGALQAQSKGIPCNTVRPKVRSECFSRYIPEKTVVKAVEHHLQKTRLDDAAGGLKDLRAAHHRT